MPVIKLKQLQLDHLKRRRQQQYVSIDCPGQIGSQLDHSCWHFATNYLKSYWRIERQRVNNHKTLCWLTFAWILLTEFSGWATAVGSPTSPAGGMAALEIGTCKQTLGMESGAIADFQITASSAHDMGNVGPQHAR
ncbi:hypothetical protein ACLKA6_013121 [Drosophila palustris]